MYHAYLLYSRPLTHITYDEENHDTCHMFYVIQAKQGDKTLNLYSPNLRIASNTKSQLSKHLVEIVERHSLI